MATGIELPTRVDKNGRLVLLSGDDYIEQLVFTGLGDPDSDNPFQDVGLGEFMIFGINDQMSDGEIRERIVDVFAELEADQLAKLDDPLVDLVFSEDTGDLGVDKKVTITYTNMETQERKDIEVPIPTASDA
jgi:hypothetical protein